MGHVGRADESALALGAELRRLREARGWTLRAAARRLGYRTHSEWSAYERGARIVPAARLDDAVRLLGGEPAVLEFLRAAAIAERERGITTDPSLDRLPRLGPVVARPALLEALTAALSDGVAYVTGPSGAGKTVLVAQWLHQSRLGARRWVDDERDVDDALAAVAGGGVVVFDGVAPRETTAPIVVIQRDAAGDGDVVVGPLSDAEAIECVRLRLPDATPAEAATLAELVGHLAGALVLTTAFVAESAMTIDEFVHFAHAHHGLVAESAPALARAFARTIAGLGPLEAKVFGALRFFGGAALPVDLVAALADEPDRLELHRALGRLHRLGLVDNTPGAVRPHPFAASVALQGDDARDAVAAALAVVTREVRGDDPVTTLDASIVPAMVAIGRVAEEVGLGHDAAALVQHAGAVAAQQGDTDAAIPTLERAVVLFGDDALGRADALTDLGGALAITGDAEAARHAHEEALGLYRGAGEDGFRLAAALNNVAVAVQQLGELTAAAALYREALERKEALYGATHAQVAHGLLNLGGVLADLGDPEAIPLLERAVVLVADLDDALLSIAANANLGLALVDTDPDRAVALLTEAADRIDATLSPVHPYHLAVLPALAAAAATVGAFASSADHYERATALTVQLNGPGTEQHLELVEKHAAALEAWGKPAAARSLRRTIP